MRGTRRRPRRRLPADGGPGPTDTNSDGEGDECTIPACDRSEGPFEPTQRQPLSGAYLYDSLHIPAGVTITGSGAESLVTTVCRDATVEGTVHVSGRDGKSGSAPNPTGGVGGAGGTACCGGYAGGKAESSKNLSGAKGLGPGGGGTETAPRQQESFDTFWNGSNAGGGGMRRTEMLYSNMCACSRPAWKLQTDKDHSASLGC